MLSNTKPLAEQTALVLGLGITGTAVCEALSELGLTVRATDSREKDQIGQSIRLLAPLGVEIITGGHLISALQGADFIVASPSILDDLPILMEARRLEIPVYTEIDLAYQWCLSELIAVTGTNGKSTTCDLISKFLNIPSANTEISSEGTSLIKLAIKRPPIPKIVVELKSFQLAHIGAFRANTGVLLNISHDHTDKFHSFTEYADAKRRVFQDQQMSDHAILNYDDNEVMKVVPKLKSQITLFSKSSSVANGIWNNNGKLMSNITNNGQTVEIIDWADIILPSELYIEDVLASVAVALIHDIPLEVIRKILKSYKGLPHRLEYVTTINGVKFYNDSKSKNPSSTVKALATLGTSTVLIAGGKSKENNYDILRDCIAGLKGLVLLGDAVGSLSLLEIARSTMLENVMIVQDMKQAVKCAIKWASEGDIILLSPASDCDTLFINYHDRGMKFLEAIQSL